MGWQEVQKIKDACGWSTLRDELRREFILDALSAAPREDHREILNIILTRRAKPMLALWQMLDDDERPQIAHCVEVWKEHATPKMLEAIRTAFI